MKNELYRYYSQYGEDFLLWNFFDFKPKGFFIDIGAFDGIHLSNSYSFELIGWQGICVEPHPYYFKLCHQNRPNSTCINSACGDNELQKAILHVDNTGLFSSLHTIGDEENITGHFGLLKDIKIEIDTIEVDIIPLNSVLEKFQPEHPIDFVSIDVEGAELEVLRGFNIEKYKPRVVVIETNNEEFAKEINAYLQSVGYIFARKTNANSLYVTTHADAEKMNSIELNCIIEKQSHPLGVDYTVPAYLDGLVLYKGERCRVFSKLDHFEKMVENLLTRIAQKKSIIKENDTLLQAANKARAALLNDIQSHEATISQLREKLSGTLDAKIRKLLGKN